MDDHDHDPYCADPPRDSRAKPFLEAMGCTPTVKILKCAECQLPLAASDVKCVNCHGDKPTGIKE
jgi:hypothetical protein